MNNSKYFNLGSYFILPSITIGFGILSVMKKEKIELYLEHKLIVSIILYGLFLITVLFRVGQFDMIAATMLYYTFMLMILLYDFNEKSIKLIINTFIFSGAIFAIILLIQQNQPYIQSGSLRYGIFYSESNFYDVNFTAAYMTIPALFSYGKIINSKYLKTRLMYLFLFSVIFLAIAMTGSRGSLLPLISALFLIIFVNKRLNLFYIIIFIVLSMIIFRLIPEELYFRYFEDSYIDSNLGRLRHWEYGFNAFTIKPIFGNGLYSASEIISNQLRVNYTAHSTFLAIIVQYGLLGAIPNFILLGYPLYSIKKMKLGKDIYIIYLVFLITMITIEANITMIMLIPLTIFYIIIKFARKNPEHNFKNFFN